ncbi:40S ribosomal protein S5-1 [Hordeum vulgare]|nr:40S ribosomal protein S5-1 [Hordeum vulgare]
MTSPKVPKDKFFDKVINPYLVGVLQHPQSIEMREGVLHIRDVEGPKKTGSMEARLEAMEQQVFKCHGMVERGLNANHMMITEFTNKHKIDANDIGKHLSRLYDRIDHLQAQIYNLQNQNSGLGVAGEVTTLSEPVTLTHIAESVVAYLSTMAMSTAREGIETRASVVIALGNASANPSRNWKGTL